MIFMYIWSLVKYLNILFVMDIILCYFCFLFLIVEIFFFSICVSRWSDDYDYKSSLEVVVEAVVKVNVMFIVKGKFKLL